MNSHQAVPSPNSADDSISQALSVEQLCQLARDLAQSHLIQKPSSRRNGRALIRRFRNNATRLRFLNREFREAVRQGVPIPSETDWIIDNFFVIEEQLQEIDNDLPPTYLDELPRLQNEEPRVYLLGHEVINRMDAAIDEDSLSQFLNSYQQIKTLSIGEMWAFPSMLRISLVEKLRRLSDQLWITYQAQLQAKKIVQRYLQHERFDVDPNRIIQIAPWIAAEAERNRSTKTAKLLSVLHNRLNEIGWRLSDLERLNHQSTARSQISFANTITSMRLMSAMDWTTFFEDHCAAEKQLRLDPAKIYALCDPSTRNQYRTAVEKLAKRTEYSDEEIAKVVVEICNRQYQRQAENPPIESHVGYWLIDKGRGQLENKLRFEPNKLENLVRQMQNAPFLAYFGVLVGLWVVCFFTFGFSVAWSANSWLGFALISLFAAIALTELAMQVGNWWFTLVLPPHVIPKLELESGIPAKHPTIVVVPCMFGSVNEVDTMLGRLENHYLSNGIPGLKFALLTDFSDAATETTKSDAAILEAAAQKLKVLNHRYALDGKGPFLILHRPRTFNPKEGKWIGWERKRGKLMEFGRWILGDDSINYVLKGGDIESLQVFRSAEVEPFVITLDADTQLPHGAVTKMIGTLAHPLVRPVWNQEQYCVERGYVVLQPRVSIDLNSRMASDFAALHSAGAGVSPYVIAASDVYQDLFHEGSFTGKGIYDLKTFENALHGAFPENAILSHDLIEGAHTRVAMTSDIEVFDGYPSRYDGDAKRIHRWVRGDWQILPWLFETVPAETGYRTNTIHGLSKWKIFDNIRRSLIAPAIVGWLAATAYDSPAMVKSCLLGVLAIFFAPSFLHAGFGLLHKHRKIRWLDHIRSIWLAFVHNILLASSDLIFVAHKSQQMLDAIVRTIYRMKISRRNLLQWQTAQAVEMQNKGSLASMAVYLWASPVIAIAILSIAQPPAIYYCLPLLALWFFAPMVAYTLSRKKQHKIGNVNPIDARYLRRIARRTWSFFEAYATEDYNYLPPDNVQEIPDGRIASRISPTNEGLFLLSAMGARDCGFISITRLIHLWNESWSSWRKLETHKGHYFNWYETSELRTLPPRYVSTVDSGNLAACLLAWQICLREVAQQPIFQTRMLNGFADTLDCLIEDLRKALYGTTEQIAGYSDYVRELLEETEVAKKSIERMIDSHSRITDAGVEYTDMAIADWEQALSVLQQHILTPLDRWSLDVVSEWLRRKLLAFKVAMRGFMDDLEIVKSFESRVTSQPLRTVSLNSLRDMLGLEPLLSEPSQKVLQFTESLERLDQDAAKAFAEMDFKFLLNTKRKLFRIGYNADTNRFDRSHYDMLASESRLGSYVAIGKGDAPASHWFRLGRQAAYNAGSVCLISWGGTMFEYLMPSLLQKHFEKSLLTETAITAIRKQQEYVRRRDIPWGISESAYASFNNLGDYLYQSFGVPGLGLKRGLARDLVVAPYATLLSLDLAGQAASDNLRRLEAFGGLGPWGFYDAIDFTTGRATSLSNPTVVRNYMAHHHGMSILAIINCIFAGKMQQRFSAHSIARSCELLLQEKYPSSVPHQEDLSQTWDEVSPNAPDDSLVVRRLEKFDTLRPRTMMLSNGRMSLLLTHDGKSYCKWQETMLSRWRFSENPDMQGLCIYLRDIETDNMWSPTYAPYNENDEEASTTFAIDKAEYRKRHHGIETLLDITISPISDAEVRRLRLTNHSTKTRRVEITSYFELALSTQAADVAHPGFQKLFVSTSHDAQRPALMAQKRSPSGRANDLWVGQVVSHDSKSPIRFELETSREKFVGRLQDLKHPRAIRQPWSQTIESPLDPIFAFRCVVELAPEQTIHLAYTTVASSDINTLNQALSSHTDFRAAAQTFELSWAHFQAELKGRRIDAKQSHLYQRLGSYLAYPSNALRRLDSEYRNNSLNQSAWWRHSISGDLPILTVAVESTDQTTLLQELFSAHGYLQAMGFDFDLVVIDKTAGSNPNTVLEMLKEIQSMITVDSRRPGKSFVIPANTLSDEELHFIQSSSTIYLDAANGELASQLSVAVELEKEQQTVLSNVNSRVAALTKKQTANFLPSSIADSLEDLRSIPKGLSLDGDNSWGIVVRGGYEIDLTNPRPTPAPWSLVMSNPNFGCIITEHGGGFTWFGNSRQFKLTSWSNDPTTDPTSECLWIRDEDTYQLVRPIEDADSVQYQSGQAIFKCEWTELLITTTVWVDAKQPIKFVSISIENKDVKPRRLSATYFADVILGDTRERTQLSLQSFISLESRAVLAHNPQHEDFPTTAMMLTSNIPTSTWTGNNLVFRKTQNGLPLALAHEPLENVPGFGPETCIAGRSNLTIAPHAKELVCFAIAAVDEIFTDKDVRRIVDDPNEIESSKKQVDSFWKNACRPFEIHTPNESMNRLVNDWLLYQTIACRIFARTSFYQCGGAYGFRDQLQDAMAAVYAMPSLSKEIILKAASRQFEKGDVQHWWHEPSGKGTRTRFSDDRLFLPFAVMHYCAVTGDNSILDEVIPFLESPELAAEEHERYETPIASKLNADLFEHCVRAIDVSLTFGPHGLPLIGCGDWNDGMNRVGIEGKGESVWLAWFLIKILDDFTTQFAERLPDDKKALYKNQSNQLRESVEKNAWDGDWYLRAYFDDGTKIGSKDSRACKIDLLSQAWAVLVEKNRSRAKHAFEEAVQRLVDHDLRLIRLFTPAFNQDAKDPGYINSYLTGVRENGGQYTHAAIWLAQAAIELGNYDQAMQFFDYLNPLLKTNTPVNAERYQIEPYVMTADVYTNAEHLGRGGWSWYTGAAGWMYRLAIESILGIELRGDSIRFVPHVPKDWHSYSIDMNFGGKSFSATFSRPDSSRSKVDTNSTYSSGETILLSTIQEGSTIHIQLQD